MKIAMPVKPRKGLTLVSDERHVKQGRMERITIWRKNDQSNALPVEKDEVQQ